jgi:hypothetical protein
MTAVSGEGLNGKRVLVIGAESELGGEIVAALATAGADVGVVAGAVDADSAFQAKRLSRRVVAAGGRSLAQAIDAGNEMAVRVMVRQVGKGLGGLDAVVFCADLGTSTDEGSALAARYGGREVARSGGGNVVIVGRQPESTGTEVRPGVGFRFVATEGRGRSNAVDEVVRGVVGEPASE